MIANALRQIDGWIGPRGVAGAAAVVWQYGEIVAEHYAGEARAGIPVDETTIFGLASVTKPVTAAVVVSLVEEGRIALDEPVVRLVPEFATGTEATSGEFDELKPSVTIRQLLSHTSGLPEDLGPRHIRFRDLPSLAALIDAMCRLPLQSAPGTELRYSNAGYGILSRLVERVTGIEFWEAADERVIEPLELRHTVARPGRLLADRIAHVADAPSPGSAIEPYNSDYWRGLGLPWGGLFGSPRDLARFAGAFLPGGPHLLSDAGISAMTTDQAHGVPGGVDSLKVHWPVAFWGLGWEVKGTKRDHWIGELTSPRAFCHFGAAGTLLWADPNHDIALAVFGNRVTYRRWPFVPARWSRLSDAVIAAVS